MPQMRQVAGDFAGKPVAILGCDPYDDADNVKFVGDTMKLNYPICRIDEQTPKTFSVEAYPSLIVIDQQGVIRHFDEGYSPTLRVDLEKKIQSLLIPPTGPGK